ncbi:aldose epimerase family protein [Fervidobacterium thailandense]|uniref:Aldose 1-epimerase n=1 Tax=Fervidobacterium thailandense TaxID=1008305 RepID=A0A1E3G547_9BACT|nr:aldose epimerase family protein [Fervidobacterium thailandense]ODN31411.1 galactose mutarotase [Fervidobacterium thailandense]
MRVYKIQEDFFSYTEDGNEVYEYTLKNDSGFAVKILNYGGIIRELWVPSKSGEPIDVVLGYDTFPEYRRNPGYLGAIIGRYANRIAGGKFVLDGVVYQLALNDKNRPNALHGGIKGFDKKVWNARGEIGNEGPKLVLTYTSPDGEEGYPGNLNVTVVYTLLEDGLKIEYSAITDKPTIVNLTNHTYFNLSGTGRIYDHIIQINASKYTPVDENLIPTSDLEPVEGTPYDLRQPTDLGEALEKFYGTSAGEFDINYVLDSEYAALVYSESTGIIMKVFTSQPGMQFSTANHLPEIRGKRGMMYGKHSGFCLETQHFPNSPNYQDFPSTVLRPGEEYYEWTIFKFSFIGT